MVDMSEEDILAAHRQASRRSTPPRSAFAPASQRTLSPSPPRSADATGFQSIQVDNAPDGLDSNEYRSRSREVAVEPKAFLHSSSEKKGRKKDEKGGEKGTQRKALLASGSLDGTVKLWDVDSGSERSTLFGYVSTSPRHVWR